jgi:hypothetical protein
VVFEISCIVDQIGVLVGVDFGNHFIDIDYAHESAHACGGGCQHAALSAVIWCFKKSMIVLTF